MTTTTTTTTTTTALPPGSAIAALARLAADGNVAITVTAGTAHAVVADACGTCVELWADARDVADGAYVRAPGGRALAMAADAEPWPVPPAPVPADWAVTVPAAEIRAAAAACGTDRTRAILAGVRVEADAEAVRVAAVDGRRLHAVTLPAAHGSHGWVPAAVAAVLPVRAGAVTAWGDGEGHALTRVECAGGTALTVLAHRPPASYPAWRQCVPEDAPALAGVRTAEVREAARAAVARCVREAAVLTAENRAQARGLYPDGRPEVPRRSPAGSAARKAAAHYDMLMRAEAPVYLAPAAELRLPGEGTYDPRYVADAAAYLDAPGVPVVARQRDRYAPVLLTGGPRMAVILPIRV